MKCRSCGSREMVPLIDLGFSPPSNAYLSQENLSDPEVYFPLRVSICEECKLGRTEDFSSRESLFTRDYAYLSSTSHTWLEHAKNFVDVAISRLELKEKSVILEVASNDGYLLKNFDQFKYAVFGMEPCDLPADQAEKIGVKTIRSFFGRETAAKFKREIGEVDLLIANNVLAHVPDINDFVAGISEVLALEGVASIEFPSLTNLIADVQFDTIYHEHYSYLSLTSLIPLLFRHGLEAFDVEELKTHGGSLRVWIRRKCGEKQSYGAPLESVLKSEKMIFDAGSKHDFCSFQREVDRRLSSLLSFLSKCYAEDQLVIGYGAAAKGNTYLNAAGIKSFLLPYVIDKSIGKIDRYLPGVHSRIVDMVSAKSMALAPEYILVFPWNLYDEIYNEVTPAFPKAKILKITDVFDK